MGSGSEIAKSNTPRLLLVLWPGMVVKWLIAILVARLEVSHLLVRLLATDQ